MTSTNKMHENLALSPINKQIEKLLEIIYLNQNLKTILDDIKLPNDFPWYIGAGCINQTVWNYLTKRDITYGIGDYDIVYWDTNLSKEAEIKIQKTIKNQFEQLDAEIEIINEARVHLWFEEAFGEKIDPYTSLEQAVGTWTTTATCIGITKTADNIEVFAPYGLSDLFAMILRPNYPSVIDLEFKKKVKKWTAKWPELKVIDPKTFH